MYEAGFQQIRCPVAKILGDKTRVKGGIEIVDLAQPSSRPVSPRIKFIVVVAGIVGLAVGLAMSFLMEYINQA